MDGTNLFQLGIGLETGAHEEDSCVRIAATTETTIERDVFEECFVLLDGSEVARCTARPV